MTATRRSFLAGLGAVMAGPALAQHSQHDPLFMQLRSGQAVPMPPEAEGQRFLYSSAPQSPAQGRWITRAPLPLPRSEMAWATAWDNKMHVIGGYGLFGVVVAAAGIEVPRQNARQVPGMLGPAVFGGVPSRSQQVRQLSV